MDEVRARSILGVAGDSSPEQIKSAYRKMVLKHHPDRNRGDGRAFHEITEAYHTLADGPDSGAGQPSDEPRAEPQRPENGRGGTGTNESRAKWGAGPTDHPPEEDWGRYTREFEEDEGWWKRYEEKFWSEYESRTGGGGGNERYKAEEPREQPPLHVMVDQSLCIGCCSCETLAPDVFELNHNAKSNPKSRVKNERGAGVNLIMNAAETCPTKAIIVDDLREGRRLYPL